MKIFIWIMWLIFAGLLHLFGNNAGTAVILLSSLIIPVISWIVAVITAERAYISLDLPDKCVKGGELTGCINKSGIFSGVSCILVCENLFTGEIVRQKINLDADKINFTVETQYCGVIRVVLNDLRVCDIFGLFSWRIKKSASKRATVLPSAFDVNIKIMENINAVSDSGEYSITRPGSDNTEIHAIREYIPGDPIKNIHWKLSEKTDRLMVREFGLPAENKVLIIFEKPVIISPLELDGMAGALASVSLELSKENIRHDIIWKDMKKFELDGETNIELFYMEFLSESFSYALMGIDEARKQREYSHVIIISPNKPPEILEL